MSCKGLVALVVFNLLLSANLITPVLFAIFVGYIIITTFLLSLAQTKHTMASPHSLINFSHILG